MMDRTYLQNLLDPMNALPYRASGSNEYKPVDYIHDITKSEFMELSPLQMEEYLYVHYNHPPPRPNAKYPYMISLHDFKGGWTVGKYNSFSQCCWGIVDNANERLRQINSTD